MQLVMIVFSIKKNAFCTANQGRRKLPKGGAAALLDQSGDAAKGSDIEVCKHGQKKSPSFSVIRMGSRGTFTLRRLASVASKLFEAIDL